MNTINSDSNSKLKSKLEKAMMQELIDFCVSGEHCRKEMCNGECINFIRFRRECKEKYKTLKAKAL